MLPFRAGRTTLCWLRADPAAGRPTVLDDDSGCWGMHGADGSGHLPPPPADADPAAGYLARFVPIRCSAVFGCRVPRETCGWVVFQDATRVAGGMHGEDDPGLPRPSGPPRSSLWRLWVPGQGGSSSRTRCGGLLRSRRRTCSCMVAPSGRRVEVPAACTAQTGSGLLPPAPAGAEPAALSATGQVRSMRRRRCAGPQGST